MDKFPSAEYLTMDEVDYELSIREKLDENTIGLDLSEKQRCLRKLFKADAKIGRNYRSNLSIRDEYPVVGKKFDEVKKALWRYGMDTRWESVLLHCYYRAKRCSAENESEKIQKRDLVRSIGELMRQYKVGPPASPVLDRINYMINEAEQAKALSPPRTENEQHHLPLPELTTPVGANNLPIKNTGAIPKTRRVWETELQQENRELREKIEQLEKTMQSVLATSNNNRMTCVVGNRLNGDSNQTTSEPSRREKKVRFDTLRPDAPRPVYSVLEGPNTITHQPTITRQTQNVRPNLSEQYAGSSDDYESSDDSYSYREPRFTDRTRHETRGHRRQNQAHQTGRDFYRVEKWKLRFTGENRSGSVESFLYKLKKIAEREGVSDRQLLRDVHLLLDGLASDWFFTFVDQFDDWQTFEHMIKYRFGNPNQDQGIRQKIHERKQQRGESFIAFVTEIEKLTKMLSKPLSKSRKFEIVWDNMRLHYRSKLATIEVNDLHQLIKLNYRIDATDPSLQMGFLEPARRPVNNLQIDAAEYTSDEEEMVNAVELNQPRERQAMRPRTLIARGNRQEEQPNTSAPPTRTTIHHITINPSKCPHITVRVFDTEIEALLDSGAGVSVTNSSEFAIKYGLKILPAAIRVSTADGTAYKCLGYLNVPYTYKNMTRVIPTIIVPQISRKLILGTNFWEGFSIKPMIDMGYGLEKIETLDIGQTSQMCFTVEPTVEIPKIPEKEDETLDFPTFDSPAEPIPDEIETEHNLTTKERAQLITTIKQFAFTAPGKLGRTNLIQHEIILKEDAKPRNQPVYKCSPYIQKEIDEEIERFKQLDAIEECYSEWTNPLVAVRKSNGKIRVCLDSRRINAMTVKDAYPMQNMQDIFHRLENAKFFSVIDLKDAYFQIPLKEECRNFTAFRTSKGLFRFKVCPFGLTNAPFTMCRLMNKVIGFDLQPNVFVYLDDVVVATKTLNEHFKLLRIIAGRLKAARLTISLEKSKFCQRKVMYLGYLLSEHGVAIDESRIQPILDYARPKTVKDVRRLMGLAGFYQKFISNYSEITTPITNLLKKDKKKISWTEEAETAFNKLKSALISAPILGNPDFSKPFTIESDASDNAIGAALVQELEGQTRIISYFSKKLSNTQRKYAAVEKECLAVLMAIDHFRHYVEGTKFRIVTDARSLLWLFKIGAESGNSKLLRWALRIQSYDVELVYRKGKNNITADCLSRSIETVTVTSLDPQYDDLMSQIEANPIQFKDYKVIDGRIYKYCKSQNKRSDPRFAWKWFTPKAARTDVIRTEHGKAHFGFEKTLGSVKERHFWPGMAKEIKNFCRECVQCQTSKAVNINATPPMGSQKPVEYPWQFVTLDYIGPLPVSGKKRSTCLLVATDVFSKFVLVQPFREAKADSLVDFVENMIFRLFGVPEIVLTDNGTQFLSKIFRELLVKYNVNHWLTPAYHPQVNNTERVNRVVTTAIRATLKKEHKHWTNNLQEIANAIRNAVHDSTKYSPYFIVFGRNQVSDGKEYAIIRDNHQQEENCQEKLSEERKQLFEEIVHGMLLGKRS
ncbi:uncharacterized protein LOC129765578 [Toxorhynchites rutilus septentrionalis]|uniref:uncharacterized protein LOC129765578 n=1 Tax=Toxorhynchites rutilus septentrionalis TaxID=329112 RepID=UPI00247AF7AD|nr:uncharacterized protein LOC129765578 [Toxorhynchites rutilus septentrionalis]